MLDWLQEKLTAAKELPLEFPGLRAAGFEVKDVTSRKTALYNCVAYAAKDETRPWWPFRKRRSGLRYYYWPEEDRAATAPNFIRVFESLGYEVTESRNREDGYEKVALFVNEQDEPKHMARELGDGVWYSKLGDEQDIRHHTLEALENDRYGKAKYFLRKRIVNNA